MATPGVYASDKSHCVSQGFVVITSIYLSAHTMVMKRIFISNFHNLPLLKKINSNFSKF